jgi:hypothetical protein
MERLQSQADGLFWTVGLCPTRQQVRLLTAALLVDVRGLAGAGGGGCERQNCLWKPKATAGNRADRTDRLSSDDNGFVMPRVARHQVVIPGPEPEAPTERKGPKAKEEEERQSSTTRSIPQGKGDLIRGRLFSVPVPATGSAYSPPRHAAGTCLAASVDVQTHLMA